MAGSIFIPLISVFDGKGVRDAKSGLGAIAGVVKNLKGVAIAAAASMATVGAISFVKDSVTSARNLERNMVGLENVFGNLTPVMGQFAKDSASIGLSQEESSRASTFLGSVLKQSGFTMEETAEQTKNLVGLASDLAATYGYDVSEALTGMTALFRGEYDPIEKFGVAMKQSEVNAVIAARGQDNLAGAALRNAQAVARLDLLYARSQDAQGAYAEQSGTLFTSQKNLAAAFENLKASLGASLTQPLADILTALLPVMDTLGKTLAPIFTLIGKVITALAPLVEPVIEVVLLLFDALMPIWEVLEGIITPLLVPLVDVLKLLIMIIKPLIPVIKLLATVIGAVLTPIVSGLAFALHMVFLGIELFFKGITALANSVGLGSMVEGFTEGLAAMGAPMNNWIEKTREATDSTNAMTDKLSKKLPVPDVDGTVGAITKITKASETAKTGLTQLEKTIKGLKESLITGFNITDVLETTADKVTQSVVFLNGKFKTVVSTVKGTSTNIVDSFQKNLKVIKTFSRNINRLLAADLDPALIGQIVSAGPEAGNATAEAILKSGKTGIDSLNDTYDGIKTVAARIAKNVAPLMTVAGEEIGLGMSEGLLNTSSVIKDAGTSLATDFVESFKAKTLDDFLTFKIPTPGEDKGKDGGKKYQGPGIDPDTGKPIATKPLKKWQMPYKFNLNEPGTIPQYLQAPAGQAPTTFRNLRPDQILNPYTAGSTQAFAFGAAQNIARSFNITVNVPVTADKAEAGRLLIDAIQSYEKNGGKTWRNG